MKDTIDEKFYALAASLTMFAHIDVRDLAPIAKFLSEQWPREPESPWIKLLGPDGQYDGDLPGAEVHVLAKSKYGFVFEASLEWDRPGFEESYEPFLYWHNWVKDDGCDDDEVTHWRLIDTPPDPCPLCGGEGGLDSGGVNPNESFITLPCPDCKGTGNKSA